MRHAVPVPLIAVLLVFCLVGGALFAVPPSESAKQDLLKAVSALAEATSAPLAKFDALKAANQLGELEGQKEARQIGKDLARPMLEAIDAYDAAIAGGGGHDPWPATDPDIAKARQTIDEMRAKLEAAGMFTMRLPGEPAAPFQDRVDVIYYTAWDALLTAKEGKTDEARDSFKQLDSRVEGAKAEAGAADHPGFKRFLAAYDKLKAEAGTLFAQADTARGGIDKEVADLTATYGKVQTWFQEIEKRKGGGTEEAILAAMSELATMTENFEKNDLPAVTKQMEEFAAKYGKSSMEIDNKILEVNGKNDYNPSPGYVYDRLSEYLAKSKEMKTERAADLYADAVRTLDGISEFAEKIQVERMLVCKTKLQLAAQLDPANAPVKERLAGVDAEIASRSTTLEKEIDERVWAGHSPTFQGPGSADALAAEAVTYLKNTGWEANPPKELLAVRIVGPWTNGDKNLLGEFINYQLPIEAVFRMKGPAEEAKDLARVFEFSLYTQDKVYSPPFSKSAILGSWYMRASKVAAGGAGGAAGAGPSGGWGLFAIVFWLGLALVNLAAGFLAAEPLLTAKAPPLVPVTKALAPLKVTVGLAAMAIGGIAFLRALVLYFAPLADLLPQAAAILAGLLLARERLNVVATGMTAAMAQAGKAAPADGAPATVADGAPAAAPADGGGAPAKPAITPEVAVAKLAALEPLAVPIGLACLALGVLHLVLGGLPLI
ncbi:MAG: hypothetical protein GX442_26700 [Candidatus Riflebacteria bacterium]|nr:hypothetical protein [Candidatus Riflebacteria bacterium]